MILLSLAAVAASPASPSNPKPEPIDRGSWISSGDYPRVARIGRQSGRVVAELEVDEVGAVRSCKIAVPSGVDSLDQATCPLLVVRAHFNPAHDKSGLAVKSSYTAPITWHMLPAPPGMPTPINYIAWFTEDDYPAAALMRRQGGQVVAELRVDESGAVEGCQIAIASGVDILDQVTCDLLTTRARFIPARDSSGHEIKSTYRVPMVWRVPTVPLGSPIPIARGQWIADDYPLEAYEKKEGGIVRVRLGVDVTGLVKNCTVTESSKVALLDNAACALLLARAKFAPAQDETGRAIVSSYSVPVMWKPPQSQPPAPKATRVFGSLSNVYPAIAVKYRWEVRAYYDVAVDRSGRVGDCIILQSSGHQVLDEATCEIITHKGVFSPAIDLGGAKVASHFNSVFVWKLPH